MKLVSKKVIPAETCFDISVEDTNCFFANGVLVHNSNAGVRIKNGEVAAQSRTRLIDVKEDNAGFAKWVKTREEWFKSLPIKEMFGSTNVTVFGEWCGPGIMKGTAINQIPNKVFVVFAVIAYEWRTGNYVAPTDDDAIVLSEPAEIERLFVNKPDDVYVLPWCSEPIEVQYGNRAQLQEVADRLNKYIAEIEPCDPWVKATFGIEGTAEGAVYYPVDYEDRGQNMQKWFSDFVFKAKGEKHKVVKTKEAVQVDPEVAKSIAEFVTMFVTDARCEQGLNAIGNVLDMKKTGDFLKWLSQDVLKESTAELEASGLTWEQVQKSVQVAAREWYARKVKTI